MKHKELKITDEELWQLADEAVKSYKAIQLKSADELKTPEMQKILEEARALSIAFRSSSSVGREAQKVALLALKNGSEDTTLWFRPDDSDNTSVLINAKCSYTIILYSTNESTKGYFKQAIVNMFRHHFNTAGLVKVIKSNQVPLLPLVYYYSVVEGSEPIFQMVGPFGRKSEVENAKSILSDFAMQWPEQFDALLSQDPFEKVWPSLKIVFQNYNVRPYDRVAVEVLRRYQERQIEKPAAEIVKMHEAIPTMPAALDEIFASYLAPDEKASNVQAIVTEVKRQVGRSHDTVKALEASLQDVVMAIKTENKDTMIIATLEWLNIVSNYLRLKIDATAPKHGVHTAASTTSSDDRRQLIDFTKQIDLIKSAMGDKTKYEDKTHLDVIKEVIETAAKIQNDCPKDEKIIKQQASYLIKDITDKYPEVAPAKRRSGI